MQEEDVASEPAFPKPPEASIRVRASLGLLEVEGLSTGQLHRSRTPRRKKPSTLLTLTHEPAVNSNKAFLQPENAEP